MIYIGIFLLFLFILSIINLVVTNTKSEIVTEDTYRYFVHDMKTLKNTTSDGASKNVRDIQFWGDGDMFKLISKAWSEEEGWMKSTKAMDVGVGCVIQVTTQQINPDGSYSIAEALTYVPGVKINKVFDGEHNVIGRIIEPRN